MRDNSTAYPGATCGFIIVAARSNGNIPEEAWTRSEEIYAGSARLTLSALANMSYTLVEDNRETTVKLVDGEGRVNTEYGTDQYWLDKKHIIFGDLNGDGVDDALVVLTSSSGGSGIFSQLVAVINNRGKGEAVAAKGLGDRTKINSIKIKDGGVTVDTLTQGPNDGLCCPTVREVLRLVVQRDQFVTVQ